jgi:two-component system sensor kinase FixL
MRASAARAASRGPWHLRSHLVGVVLIAILPSLVIAGLAAKHVSESFVAHHDRDLQATAATMARLFERQVEAVSRAATAAVMAEENTDGPARARLAAQFAALRVEAVLWRPRGNQDAGNLSAESLTSAPVAADPHLAEAVSRVAKSAAPANSLELVSLPSSDSTVPVPLYGLVALSGPAHAGSVLQLALPAALVSDFLWLGERETSVATGLVRRDGHIAVRPHARSPARVAGWMTELATWPTPRPGLVANMLGRDGTPYLVVTQPLAHAPDWLLVVFGCSASSASGWIVPLAEFAVAVLVCVGLAFGAAVWLAGRLTRPLALLTLDASAMASTGALSQQAAPPTGVREFNALRASLGRSTAVLRRRAAAERMALNEARTGHELLASVVTATDDLIYVKNLDLRLLLANRATLSAGGVERKEYQVLGRGIAQLLPAEQAAQEEAMDRRVLAGGESNSMRLDWPGEDGVSRSFMLSKSLWRDTSGRVAGVVTVAHDVSEHRAAEARLAAVQADLLRVSRLSAMGAMASGLAHELNQPLAAATNYLNAAGRLLSPPGGEAGTLQARADRLARAAVIDAADQMLRAGDIVRRLRAFIGRGEAALRREDVGGVIREACELARADGAAGAADLVVRDVGCGEMALLDRTQMQQVLLNLIRNAAEAMAGREGSRIEIACARLPDAGLSITVADNGPGLAPDVARRLFEPFVSTKRDGMGIGLAICRTIVEGHGGKLAVASPAGGGAVFSVVLPAVQTGREPVAATADAA